MQLSNIDGTVDKSLYGAAFLDKPSPENELHILPYPYPGGQIIKKTGQIIKGVPERVEIPKTILYDPSTQTISISPVVSTIDEQETSMSVDMIQPGMIIPVSSTREETDESPEETQVETMAINENISQNIAETSNHGIGIGKFLIGLGIFGTGWYFATSK